MESSKAPNEDEKKDEEEKSKRSGSPLLPVPDIKVHIDDCAPPSEKRKTLQKSKSCYTFRNLSSSDSSFLKPSGPVLSSQSSSKSNTSSVAGTEVFSIPSSTSFGSDPLFQSVETHTEYGSCQSHTSYGSCRSLEEESSSIKFFPPISDSSSASSLPCYKDPENTSDDVSSSVFSLRSDGTVSPMSLTNVELATRASDEAISVPSQTPDRTILVSGETESHEEQNPSIDENSAGDANADPL